MKPFNLEEAKAGKPVVTRIGYPVRILAYDRKSEFGKSIVAAIDYPNHPSEGIVTVTKEGKVKGSGEPSDKDLFMKSEKKTGWIIIYRPDNVHYVYYNTSSIYPSKEEAVLSIDVLIGNGYNIIDLVKIEWEE